MALPKIAPYSYREQEHQNRVNWRVDPARAALLVHDMQRYFVRAFELERDGQPLPDAQINIAIANIRRLLDAAHAANIPVYYTAQPPRQNPADRRLLTDFWGDGLQDDENARILDELAPTEADTGAQEPAPDTVIHADRFSEGRHIGPRGVADLGHGVDEGDLRGQEGVRTDLDQLGGGVVGDDPGDALLQQVLVDGVEHGLGLLGVGGIGRDPVDDAVGVEGVGHGEALAQELGVPRDVGSTGQLPLHAQTLFLGDRPVVGLGDHRGARRQGLGVRTGSHLPGLPVAPAPAAPVPPSRDARRRPR